MWVRNRNLGIPPRKDGLFGELLHFQIFLGCSPLSRLAPSLLLPSASLRSSLTRSLSLSLLAPSLSPLRSALSPPPRSPLLFPHPRSSFSLALPFSLLLASPPTLVIPLRLRVCFSSRRIQACHQKYIWSIGFQTTPYDVRHLRITV